MAELVYQTWERITGRPWSDAHKGGFTTGSFADNIALQKRLLGGWNPYKPAAKPKPKPVAKKPAAKAAPKPSVVGPVPVAPGITAKQWEAMLAEQNRNALALEALEKENLELQRQRDADARMLQEAQLSANPGDFVAYELYKRSLQEQGFTPQGAVRSDEDIQDIFSLALGLNEGDTAGTGRFGVDIPATQSISRSELQNLSSTDIDILSSFLRGGVQTGEPGSYLAGRDFQGINPEDFFTELEEGLIPVLPGQRTQYNL